MVKAVSGFIILADVESQLKKYLPASFFLIFKGTWNLKFDHLYPI